MHFTAVTSAVTSLVQELRYRYLLNIAQDSSSIQRNRLLVEKRTYTRVIFTSISPKFFQTPNTEAMRHLNWNCYLWLQESRERQRCSKNHQIVCEKLKVNKYSTHRFDLIEIRSKRRPATFTKFSNYAGIRRGWIIFSNFNWVFSISFFLLESCSFPKIKITFLLHNNWHCACA